MGLVYWLFGRSLDPTLRFINDKFGRKPDVAAANVAALRAGWAYGETTEAFGESYQVEAAELTPGTYRNIMGNQALAWGLITASKLSGKDLFYGTYPITPASDILARVDQVQELWRQDLSSGRRNRSGLRDDRRSVRRNDGGDRQ